MTGIRCFKSKEEAIRDQQIEHWIYERELNLERESKELAHEINNIDKSASAFKNNGEQPDRHFSQKHAKAIKHTKLQEFSKK